MANALPEMCLKGNVAENWKLWKGRFLNYIKASEIDKKDDEVKCALLLQYMGQEGDRIYTTFNIPEKAAMSLEELIKKFEDHFQPRKNLTYERYKFFNLKQQNTTLENYITTLNEQANKCEFDKLKDSLIKCALISGVNNNEIREKLLQKDDMSLEECVQDNERRSRRYGFIQECTNCGNSHPVNQCPAYGKMCTNCKRRNHYAKVYRSKYIRTVTDEETTRTYEPDLNKDMGALFIGEINNKQEQLSWQISIVINN